MQIIGEISVNNDIFCTNTVLFRMSNLINKEGPKWSGHVEHVEQLERGLCQHCLSQMPGGGEETFRIVNDVMDGGW